MRYRYVVDFAKPGVRPLRNPLFAGEESFFADLLTASFVPDASAPAQEDAASGDRSFGTWLRNLVIGPGWISAPVTFTSGLQKHRSGYSSTLYQQTGLILFPGVPAPWGTVSENPSVQRWQSGQRMLVRQTLVGEAGAVSSPVLAQVTLERITPVAALGQADPVRVVHTFQRDGGGPAGALAVGADGATYGTFLYGGTHDCGAIYSIAVDGTSSLMHSFAQDEGVASRGGLLRASDGSLLGTTMPGPGFITPHHFSGVLLGMQRRGLGVDASPTGTGPVIFTPE